MKVTHFHYFLSLHHANAMNECFLQRPPKIWPNLTHQVEVMSKFFWSQSWNANGGKVYLGGSPFEAKGFSYLMYDIQTDLFSLGAFLAGTTLVKRSHFSWKKKKIEKVILPQFTVLIKYATATDKKDKYLDWFVVGELTALSLVTKTRIMLSKKAKLSCKQNKDISWNVVISIPWAFWIATFPARNPCNGLRPKNSPHQNSQDNWTEYYPLQIALC